VAFIDVLDQHTLADMAKTQRAPAPPPPRKIGASLKAVGATHVRAR
jgi:hypothetical protein